MSDHRQEPRVSSVLEPSEASTSDRPSSVDSSGTYSNPPVELKGRSGVTSFLLFCLSAAALGLAGYLFWQIGEMAQNLEQQQVRIAELEGRLSTADDESTQSLTELSSKVQDLGKQLKQANSEIVTLWEASKEAKAQLTAANKQGVEASQSKLAELAASVSTINKRIDSHSASTNTALASVNTALDNLKKSSESLPDSVTKGLAKQSSAIQQLQGKVDTNNKKQELLVQSLREKLSSQLSEKDKQINQLSTKIGAVASESGQDQDMSAIEKSVRENQEAIRAIDVFRQTVSRDLIQLKERINTQ